jgi:hypothetical protein
MQIFAERSARGRFRAGLSFFALTLFSDAVVPFAVASGPPRSAISVGRRSTSRRPARSSRQEWLAERGAPRTYELTASARWYAALACVILLHRRLGVALWLFFTMRVA